MIGTALHFFVGKYKNTVVESRWWHERKIGQILNEAEVAGTKKELIREVNAALGREAEEIAPWEFWGQFSREPDPPPAEQPATWENILKDGFGWLGQAMDAIRERGEYIMPGFRLTLTGLEPIGEPTPEQWQAVGARLTAVACLMPECRRCLPAPPVRPS